MSTTAPQPITDKAEFLALTPAAQFERLIQAELDRDGFERLLRSEQRARADEKQKLEIQVKQLETACDKSDRVMREQSDEIRQQGLSVRALRAQVKELGQEPLR